VKPGSADVLVRMLYHHDTSTSSPVEMQGRSVHEADEDVRGPRNRPPRLCLNVQPYRFVFHHFGSRPNEEAIFAMSNLEVRS
jgi:hypothetical protein